MKLSNQALRRLKKAIQRHEDELTETPVVWDPETERKRALWEQQNLPVGM